MTRETKIGLLVGLAFIIVIGILLSDHINSSTDPIPADATTTFRSVENSVNAPDARPKGTDVVVAPRPVVPQDPIPVPPDGPRQQTGGQTVVTIGPGGDPASVLPPHTITPPVTSSDSSDKGDNVASNQDKQIAGNDPPKGEVNTGVSGALANEARKGGEDLIPAGGRPPVVISDPAPTSTENSSGKVRQVKAEEGDTVSKLAAKYMGGNTRANRTAIIKANPTVGEDGSKVFAGRMYTIPVADAQIAKATPAQAPPSNNTPQPAPQTKSEPAAAPPGTTWYTVKENDNLWKIASEQLGSGTRWNEIKELNSLKSDEVRVNMRLKLPAKTVASNN